MGSQHKKFNDEDLNDELSERENVEELDAFTPSVKPANNDNDDDDQSESDEDDIVESMPITKAEDNDNNNQQLTKDNERKLSRKLKNRKNALKNSIKFSRDELYNDDDLNDKLPSNIFEEAAQQQTQSKPSTSSSNQHGSDKLTKISKKKKKANKNRSKNEIIGNKLIINDRDDFITNDQSTSSDVKKFLKSRLIRNRRNIRKPG